MNIKTLALAAILATGFPLAAQAQDTNDYNSLKVSCESGAECSNFGVNFQEQGDTVAQTRRTRTRRTRRSSSDKKIYVGGTLGVFFSGELDEIDVIQNDEIGIFDLDNDDEIEANELSLFTQQRVDAGSENVDLGTGFGGSLYGGFKLSDLIGADAELLVLGGSADPTDDGSYTAVGFFLNPRFTYALNKNSDRSLYVFGSPGIGLVNLSLNDEIENVDVFGDDELSGTGFAIQAKAGVGYPISDSIDIIGQARYVNSFNNFEVTRGGSTEDQGFSAFGFEAGANFKF